MSRGLARSVYLGACRQHRYELPAAATRNPREAALDLLLQPTTRLTVSCLRPRPGGLARLPAHLPVRLPAALRTCAGLTSRRAAHAPVVQLAASFTPRILPLRPAHGARSPCTVVANRTTCTWVGRALVPLLVTRSTRGGGPMGVGAILSSYLPVPLPICGL